MELVDLRALTDVAAATSFRRASETTGVQQSTLSRRVRRLEDELGVSLFERRSTGVVLTFAGRGFLDTVHASLSALDRAAANAANAGVGQCGKLSLSVCASIASGPVRQALEAFRERHPEVEITVRERPPFLHAVEIADRTIDVSFLMSAPFDPDLREEVLWSERICAAIRDDHHLAKEKDISLEAISNERILICREDREFEIYNLVSEALRERQIFSSTLLHEITRETLMSLVASGLGIALMNESGSAVKYPNVRFVPLRDKSIWLQFRAVWSEQNDNPALRRFLSILRAIVKGQAVPNPS